jgi:hypothetical protein
MVDMNLEVTFMNWGYYFFNMLGTNCLILYVTKGNKQAFLTLLFCFWKNIGIIHNTNISFGVSDTYLMMADLDSWNM